MDNKEIWNFLLWQILPDEKNLYASLDEDIRLAYDRYVLDQVQEHSNAYIRDGSRNNPRTIAYWQPDMLVKDWLAKRNEG